MDAPLHFIENGMTIDQIPMDIMLGPVTIYDLSHLPENASFLSMVGAKIGTAKNSMSVTRI